MVLLSVSSSQAQQLNYKSFKEKQVLIPYQLLGLLEYLPVSP